MRSRKRKSLTHVDARGRVHMVDVSAKPSVKRTAIAEGYLVAAASTLDLLERGKLPKGEALATARLAGILAAKRCDELIPLCHTLPLDAMEVEIERASRTRMRLTATAATTARTGVEMEALTAVSVAALALYDMCKAVDKRMRIEGIRVLGKHKQ